MMKIEENVPLAEFTTFKIGGPARYFCAVKSDRDLLKAVKFAKENHKKFFILGGGSNILISDRGFDGLVIKNEYQGILLKKSDSHALVTAAAGEMWDEFVSKMVEGKLHGLENLSAIPGTVGAAPVQNIGAYGVDVSETIVRVRVLDTREMKFKYLSNKQCDFSYRDSIFKKKKGRYIVTHVDFRLDRNADIRTDYRDVWEYFTARGISNPSLAEVRQAVIDIRWGKLPDWKLWGTGGSFFKNPVISQRRYDLLKKRYPDLPGFAQPNGKVKVSLAWIIDKVCDARGLTLGHVGTYEKQALVLVSKPGATAQEVVNLSRELMRRVKKKTGIDIEAEVEWVN